ncbi:hypothetical protein LGM65_09450 [Burkholderia anthina]|uniref:hypothetical protein n=1 Tax=Burkholderia anthina TaxID=179879 RepID=UPI001CF276A6|nr:hypothetical protein [Burkholderia anthina]MCA8091116.1 hypothetical protein [Burkholderia anthina]
MQLVIFTISNKIDPIVRHSENSHARFKDKHAKFIFVYVCASGFVAFSVFHSAPAGIVRPCPRAAPRRAWATRL